MLNAYMVCSRDGTAIEGAALVFANSVQQARAIGWRHVGNDFTDSYLDFAAYRLRKEAWLFDEANSEKLANNVPHVIDNPKTCEHCECWGQSPIGADGLCDDCREENKHG
jgi:hypothetical protein